MRKPERKAVINYPYILEKLFEAYLGPFEIEKIYPPEDMFRSTIHIPIVL